MTLVFCKGSPEMVASLCRPSSLPPDYTAVVERHAARGFRILGLAARIIQPAAARAGRLSKMTRDQVEADLTFLGLIVMENRLKPASVAVIRELSNAKIRTIMVTGDNIQTAISVGRDCQLVKTDQTIIRVEAEDGPGQLAVTYSLPESETASILTSSSQIQDMTSEKFLLSKDTLPNSLKMRYESNAVLSPPNLNLVDEVRLSLIHI